MAGRFFIQTELTSFAKINILKEAKRIEIIQDMGINQRISACLVVYNEEQIIEKCLSSIKNLADEIIVVHDGECSDKTLEIAKKYTDKIFVREHAGVMEAHLVFAFKQAQAEWILRIDADEYIDPSDHEKVRRLLGSSVNGYTFNWELGESHQNLPVKWFQKSCLFRKNNFHYIGIPHEVGEVDGGFKKVDIFLHHKPKYNNISWKEVMRKTKKWAPIHAKYFFPELVTYECFNISAEKWINYASQVKRHLLFSIIVYPLKTFIAQLKNGLWTRPIGWKIAALRYAYYFFLYREIWRIKKKSYPINNYGK